MKLNKALSLLALAAVSVSAVACGTSTNTVDLNSLSTGGDVSTFSAKQEAPIVPGEFIIKYKSSAKNSSVNVLNTVGATKLKDIQNTGMQLIKLDSSKNSTESFQSLKNNPNVLWVEPNRVITVPKVIKEGNDGPLAHIRDAESFPNDPMFNDQYSHQLTHAQDGWKVSQGKADIILAIVDTGVDVEHPDLKGKTVPGYSAYPGQNPGKDLQGHGTHCAGIAAAITNNGVGVAGVSPNAKIQPVKVLGDNGSGTYAAVADGIAWAGTHGAKVLSMSLGGPSSSQAIEDAVNVALKNDVIVVAAMGNNGDASLSYPAAIKGVVSVGATDSDDKIASFSQFGPHISVSAPGVKILSTFPTYKNAIGMTNYGKISGTSMACPYVSGLSALVRSTFPELKGPEVRAKIEKSADDLGDAGFDPHYGWGRVNVAKALQ